MPLRQGNPQISAYTLHCQKLESLDYVFLHGSIFIQIFVVGAERRMSCAIECVRNGSSRHLRSLISVPIENRVCNFLISSNLGPILPRFRDIADFLLKQLPCLPYRSREICGFSPWTMIADPELIICVITVEVTQPI